MLFHFYLYTTSPPRDAASLGTATAEEHRSAALAEASGHHNRHGHCIVFLYILYHCSATSRRHWRHWQPPGGHWLWHFLHQWHPTCGLL